MLARYAKVLKSDFSFLILKFVSLLVVNSLKAKTNSIQSLYQMFKVFFGFGLVCECASQHSTQKGQNYQFKA